MADALLRKIVLVVRQTRLDELIARFNTVDQARFYIEHLGADFSDYRVEHRTYGEAVAEAEVALSAFGRVQRLDRRYLANFLFGRDDSIVVLGQDGLVANTLKYLVGQPVIGVNPEPRRWDGVLLPFTVPDLAKIVSEVLQGRRPLKTVTMAEAALNTGQSLLSVNDLFIGPKSHVSARYQISVGDRQEQHSSSGIIVSTGLGSTGWLKSIYAGWAATTRQLLGPPAVGAADGAFPWDADFLHYAVREPFPSRTSQAELVIGRIAPHQSMRLVSQMPEHGVIFSDGIEADFLEFNSGTQAIIAVADRRGLLVA